MMTALANAITPAVEKDILHHNSKNKMIIGVGSFTAGPYFGKEDQMEVTLCFGMIVFQIIADRAVPLNPELEPFFVQDVKNPDVTAHIRWEWDETKLPQMKCLGADILQRYFQRENGRCALTIADQNIYQARAEYTSDLKQITCFLNQERCRPENMNIGTLMRFLPMRAVFNHYGILFFHAAQVAVQGKGILFTAPSGTGKTTQAKLWRDCRGAELLCNDRTLIRRPENQWLTYGYPLDGSEPVRSTQVTPLGCIVLLRQGKGNSVERLRGGKAVSGLMSQLVIDARAHAIELLSDMMCEIPVYQLSCTPDQNAVDCLEKRLLEDGVLNDGDYQRPSLE